MSGEEDWVPRWFRKRWWQPPTRNLFDDFDEYFRQMHEYMQSEFEAIFRNAPKDLRRTRVLPDGTRIDEWGPFVYGYSMKIGPDGKPEIREFGNIKPQPKLGKAGVAIKKEREPLIDIAVTDGEVRVVAELPGVEKSDIKLHGTEDTLTISVDKAEHRYYKEIELPAKVDVKQARSTYKNGVLEVCLPIRREEKPKGESIKID
ncbi:MAG: Hsp20/alpha crystallin family protein [Candidatus Bathyarchaeota archaeon]|nr:Hsp20/alpha crystallin family protein [Candidatus Bathyarchaeota archaeon]